MKLAWRKNKPILMVAPNFAIHPTSVKFINVNGSKYAIVYVGSDPIHMEPIQ
jgi:hypothetical protein